MVSLLPWGSSMAEEEISGASPDFFPFSFRSYGIAWHCSYLPEFCVFAFIVPHLHHVWEYPFSSSTDPPFSILHIKARVTTFHGCSLKYNDSSVSFYAKPQVRQHGSGACVITPQKQTVSKNSKSYFWNFCIYAGIISKSELTRQQLKHGIV